VAPVFSSHFQPAEVTSAHGSPDVDGFPLLPYLMGTFLVSLILIAEELQGPDAGQSTMPFAFDELKQGS
jgi:hypothetical protein